MTEQEHQSPYTRGFIAAAIVIGAVLICGTALLFTNHPTLADASSTHSTSGNPGDPSTGDHPPSGDPSSRGDPASGDPSTGDHPPSGDPSSRDNPASGDPSTPGDSASLSFPPAATASTPATSPAASMATSADGKSRCGLEDGDQIIPTKAPTADGWEVSRRVVVPRSTTYGPATTDPDGFRHCFAHSPTGAVFAAYNAIAAVGDQRQAVATATKLMLPSPDTDALIRKLRTESPSSDSAAVQLAGYRILDATSNRVTVVLALPVQDEYMSANLTLVWHQGDWRVVAPPPGRPFGAPFSQHRDLDDFVTWKGL